MCCAGMPSAHSALIMGLTSAIAIKEGGGSSIFALSLVMALVIMYDAMGVRLHAGGMQKCRQSMSAWAPLHY